MKPSRVILATALAIAPAIALTAPALASAPASASTTHSVRNGVTVYFDAQQAGYAAIPETGKAKAFRYITATWTVPADACADPAADGADQILSLGTQVDGIFGFCSNDAVVFDAGYVDANRQDQVNFAANPGDSITASIFYNAATKQYTLKVSDQNSGAALNTTQPAPAAPTGWADVGMSDNFGVNSGALGGFGQVNFTAVKVIDSTGQAGGLLNANWKTGKLVENEDQGGQAPGPIYSATSPAQSAFSITG
jgi:hypothetical protein